MCKPFTAPGLAGTCIEEEEEEAEGEGLLSPCCCCCCCEAQEIRYKPKSALGEKVADSLPVFCKTLDKRFLIVVDVGTDNVRYEPAEISTLTRISPPKKKEDKRRM